MSHSVMPRLGNFALGVRGGYLGPTKEFMKLVKCALLVTHPKWPETSKELPFKDC